MIRSRRRFLAGVASIAVTGKLAARAASAAPPPAAQSGGVRFGLVVPQGGSFPDALRACQNAETLGFDTAFVSDHFMGLGVGPLESEQCFESWCLLSALAARTERIRLGVLVTGNTYRHPAVVAKMAVTVDHVSGGRLILGLGAAWLEREHKALGLPFYTPGERARRLGESVALIARLLTQAHASFDGKYYRLDDAPCEPKAIQKPHPPILIGGKGEKVIQPLAARHAQIWHFLGATDDPAAVRRACERFDALVVDAGRKPADVEKATSPDLRLLSAPPAMQRTQLQALVDAGIRHFVILAAPDADALRRFAGDVMPAIRAGT